MAHVRVRALVVALPALIASAGLVACNNNNNSSGGAASASASAAVAPASASGTLAAASAMRPQSPLRGFGPTAVFFRSTSAITDLTDDEKTKIGDLEKDLKADAAPHAEIKDLQSDLVAGVKAGKIDTTKLEPRFTAIEKVLQARHDKEADALNGLHAALTPAQRKALTADIRAKETQREERMKAHEPPKPEDMAKRRVERMTKDLTLDDTQQKKVTDLATKEATNVGDAHADAKKRMDALLTAFEADTFDAKKEDAYTKTAKAMRTPMEKEATFLSQIVPILKPEQKDKLAQKLEHRATMPPGRFGIGADGDRLFVPLWDEYEGQGRPQ